MAEVLAVVVAEEAWEAVDVSSGGVPDGRLGGGEGLVDGDEGVTGLTEGPGLWYELP